MKGEILVLSLFKKWFDQILAGEKTIEYREIKPFWERRFTKNTYRYVRFINGYGATRPFMIIELKEIKKTDKNYELYLGNILKVGNIQIKESLFSN
jgi:hypothetical protein